MPDADLLAKTQIMLHGEEHLIVNAAVRGTMSKHNDSSSRFKADDSFWLAQYAMMSIPKPMDIGNSALTVSAINESASSFVGGFNDSGTQNAMSYVGMESAQASKFRNSTFIGLYDLFRLPCNVTWDITNNNITLSAANCNSNDARRVLFSTDDPQWAWVPAPLFATDSLRYAVDQFI